MEVLRKCPTRDDYRNWTKGPVNVPSSCFWFRHVPDDRDTSRVRGTGGVPAETLRGELSTRCPGVRTEPQETPRATQ